MASLRGKAGRVASAVKRSPQLIRKKLEQKFGSHESKQPLVVFFAWLEI